MSQRYSLTKNDPKTCEQIGEEIARLNPSEYKGNFSDLNAIYGHYLNEPSPQDLTVDSQKPPTTNLAYALSELRLDLIVNRIKAGKTKNARDFALECMGRQKDLQKEEQELRESGDEDKANRRKTEADCYPDLKVENGKPFYKDRDGTWIPIS